MQSENLTMTDDYSQRLEQINKLITVYVADIVEYERRRDSLPGVLGLLYRLKELTPRHRKLLRDWNSACRERSKLERALQDGPVRYF